MFEMLYMKYTMYRVFATFDGLEMNFNDAITKYTYSEDLICLVRGCFLSRKKPLTKKIRTSEHASPSQATNTLNTAYKAT